MENFAHTLLGFSLAKTGLERATPMATASLIISSNLPDIDAVMGLFGRTPAYLQYHRGLTHSFIGLFALAVILALVLTIIDRRFRLRRNTFQRPVRPFRLFWLSLVGGLGHLAMDSSNSYGTRPLLPVSDRWFYGDLVFVLDPWIWLILGSAIVWLATNSAARIMLSGLIIALLSLVVAFAARHPTADQPIAVSSTVRIIWFVGLFIVIVGRALNWGRRGEKVARYAILLLAVYCSGLWLARQEAADRARNSLTDGTVAAVWPAPANPFVWQSIAAIDGKYFTRYENLVGEPSEWRELPALEDKFIDSLNQSARAQTFLKFARFPSASVEKNEDGYTITMRDARFDLRLAARLDEELTVRSVDVKWY
ncbi:MAG TPA: metal-dependent hydrolase [Blastocatellia bacterium]|jgi:inner membrane protein